MRPRRAARALALPALLWGAQGCSAPPAAPPAAAERGALALVVRGDTTVVEEYTRTATRLEGTVRPVVAGAKFGWARYRVELSPEGAPRRVHLALGRAGTSPESAAVDSTTTTLGPDFIVEEWPNRPPTRIQYVPGTVPWFAPSMAMFHEVVRRAHRLTGGEGEVEIPLYPLLNRAEMDRVRVRWVAPDTAEVAWPGSPPGRFVVAPDGRVLRGETGDGEFVTVRLR